MPRRRRHWILKPLLAAGYIPVISSVAATPDDGRAHNINADTVAGPDRSAYKARHVVFTTEPMGDVGAAGVTVSNVVEDNTPGRMVHDPGHPQADANGYVTFSNVNPIEEMVNMIVAQRAFEVNSKAIKSADEMMSQTNNLKR